MEMVDELGKRKVDVCCVQETKWRGGSAKFIGAKGERYKFWWDGGDGAAGVGLMIKEELCGNVIEDRRKSERSVVVVMTCGKQLMRVVSCFAPQVGRDEEEKDKFYFDLTQVLELKGANEFSVVMVMLERMWIGMEEFMVVLVLAHEIGSFVQNIIW